jgi:alpha-1,3-glucan synthase
MDPYGFKVLVPATDWVPPRPALTKFSPGHDARISSNGGNTTVTVSFEFNTVMSCTGVTQVLSFNLSSSGQGGNPTFDPNSVTCGQVQNPDPTTLTGDVQSAWSWSAPKCAGWYFEVDPKKTLQPAMAGLLGYG